MSFRVLFGPSFGKMLKQVAKKNPGLGQKVAELIDHLESEAILGTPIGKSCYKIRIALSNRGKSGGARVITYVRIVKKEVFLLAIYQKNDVADLPPGVLEGLLKEIREK